MQIKAEEIVDHLDYEFRTALEDAVRETIPRATFDANSLFRSFKRAVSRKYKTWETVPCHCVSPATHYYPPLAILALPPGDLYDR